MPPYDSHDIDLSINDFQQFFLSSGIIDLSIIQHFTSIINGMKNSALSPSKHNTYCIITCITHQFKLLSPVWCCNHRSRNQYGLESVKGFCHTLISSGDHCLMACSLWLTASRYLAPFVAQYVKFRDIPEIKRKHCYAIREIP